jgi:hypothetical protein
VREKEGINLKKESRSKTNKTKQNKTKQNKTKQNKQQTNKQTNTKKTNTLRASWRSVASLNKLLSCCVHNKTNTIQQKKTNTQTYVTFLYLGGLLPL